MTTTEEVPMPEPSCYHEGIPTAPLYEHKKLIAYADARCAKLQAELDQADRRSAALRLSALGNADIHAAEIKRAEKAESERDALAEKVKAMEAANQSRSAASMAQCSQTTQALIRMLVERDRRGLAKYGATLDRTDLTHAEWLQHMAEEMLDGAGYALAAIRANAAIDAAGGDQA